MTEPELNSLDKSTLNAWRIGNVLLWSLGALVVAVAMSFGSDILFYDVLDAAIDPFTGGGVVPDVIILVGTGLLVGASIGLVIGSRVYRSRILVAVLVTAFFVGFMPFAIPGAYGVGPILSAVGIASYFAGAAGVAALFERRSRAGTSRKGPPAASPVMHRP